MDKLKVRVRNYATLTRACAARRSLQRLGFNEFETRELADNDYQLTFCINPEHPQNTRSTFIPSGSDHAQS